jgi:hypothetical protein
VFGNKQVGNLVNIEGILLKEGYKSILEQHIWNNIQSAQQLIGKGFIFNEDKRRIITHLYIMSLLDG